MRPRADKRPVADERGHKVEEQVGPGKGTTTTELRNPIEEREGLPSIGEVRQFCEGKEGRRPKSGNFCILPIGPWSSAAPPRLKVWGKDKQTKSPRPDIKHAVNKKTHAHTNATQ